MNAKNGKPKKDRLDRIEELLNMAAAQTAENTKLIHQNATQLRETRVEFNREMKQTRAEHDREMKEIRALFKSMIRRIAY